MSKRLWQALEAGRGTRRVRRRVLFGGSNKATLEGFETMWKLQADVDIDLTNTGIGSLFAEDVYLRKEYVEIYDLIRQEFQDHNKGGTGSGSGTALVRGSSGTGKSAFLQYLVASIRNEVNDVLVVRGLSFDSRVQEVLHLSTNWLGWKTTRKISTYSEAKEVEKNARGRSWMALIGR